MRSLFIPVLILITTLSLFGQQKEDKAFRAVKAVLEAQRTAWNNGDLETYMQGYWKSPNLQFIGSSGVTHGWQGTLERYQRVYPDKAAMGHLEFEIIQTTKRSGKVVTVSGKYILTRDNKNLVGYFLLVWQKIKGKWVIVMDATT